MYSGMRKSRDVRVARNVKRDTRDACYVREATDAA